MYPKLLFKTHCSASSPSKSMQASPFFSLIIVTLPSDPWGTSFEFFTQEVNVTVALTLRPTDRPLSVPSLTQARASAVCPQPSRAARSAPWAMCSATSSASPTWAAARSECLASTPTTAAILSPSIAKGFCRERSRAVLFSLLIRSRLAPAATSSSTTPQTPATQACIKAVAPSWFGTSRAPTACVGETSIATSSASCVGFVSSSSCKTTEMLPKSLFKTPCFASSPSK